MRSNITKMSSRLTHSEPSKGANILNSSSFSIQTASDVNSLIRGDLNRLGLSEFEFARVFDDGTAIILLSNHEIAKYIVENRVGMTHVPRSQLKERFWYFFSDEEISRNLVEMRRFSSTASCVSYVERFSGYYDMFGIFSSLEHSQASSQFLNSKERIEQLSYDFRDKADGLIAKVTRDKFIVPSEMLPDFKGLDIFRPQVSEYDLTLYINKICREIQYLHQGTHRALSTRQMECVRRLFLGQTSTEIAAELGLSFRTVENYIVAIRDKFGCQSKSELIEALLKSQVG